MRDPTIYATPFDFRIDHAQVAAGELTALMAQPWQADFLACTSLWWPAQRPNQVLLSDGTPDEWDRPIDATGSTSINDVMKLVFVVPSTDATGRAVQWEVGRADE